MPKVAGLHLMNNFHDSSISRIVQNLIRDQRTGDIDWHVGGIRDHGTMDDEYVNMRAHVMNFSQGFTGFPKLRMDLKKYIVQNEISLIHSHTPRTILLTAMANSARQPVIHVATKHILYKSRDRRWGLLFFLLDWLSIYIPNQVVAVSNTMKSQITSFPFVNSERVTVVRNAIEYDRYYTPEQREECRRELGIGDTSKVIGFTGRIARAKRLDLLLEGFSDVLRESPEARLVIVGEGKIQTELQLLSDRLDISHAVTWTGFREDISRLLAAMDIYIQPSNNEGLSLSLLEGMAAGKPVIATDVGGTSEVIVDGKTGLLIPANSTKAISSAILKLLRNPDLCNYLSREARECVINEFDMQKMMKSYAFLYKELLTSL